nr:immunoglobulin light chain junction region [Macaca mulatta]MOY12660.1 immunoglobulin light chain junction region [Macaca mulatta]MOY13445.1 immunoglobulin light chain junction region [Macaca mulatta]MOY13894.1 immunoglobulin light chain junction region [Macaca mulatta]MOY14259.1 immunoglobulin light chain junction region [Macaca mulatta]
CQQYHDLLSF